jgi:hypothetical protein
MPVILILYDAREEKAFWVHVQEYFAEREWRQPARRTSTASVYLPRENVLNEEAIHRFAELRNDVLARIRRVILHEE